MYTELVIYALALGVSATFIVPILYSFASKVLPSSLTANASLPAGYPTTGMGALVTVLLWGLFLGLSIWLVSFFKPAKEAIRNAA